MRDYSIKAFVICIACYMSTVLCVAQSSQQMTDNKILRDKNSTTTTNRPRMPVYNYDYLTYQTDGSDIIIDFPSNSFPAVVSCHDTDTGSVVFTTVINSQEPICTSLPEGEYKIVITLVNNNRYSGIINL